MAKAKGKKGKAAGEKPEAKKPERFTLGWRDVQLPANINFRTQKHGDDNVQASDIRVSEIELSREEVNALAKDAYADRTLWASGGRGKPDRPAVESFEPRRLREPIETARVAIKVGGEEIKLGVCRLKAVTVEPMIGGVAHLGCMVQATPAINAKLANLIAGMDGKARIHIEYEHNAEQLEAFDGEAAPKTEAELAKFEADAKAQVDAFRRGTPTDEAPTAETH